MSRARQIKTSLLLVVLCTSASGWALAEHAESRLSPLRASSLSIGEQAWSNTGLRAIRGITIGPIESALHPDRGYGSKAYERTLEEVRAMGANWISLTPFGRVLDLTPTGVALGFEQPFEENRRAVRRAVRAAHEHGLRVFLVPHLWVESGGWRGEIEAGDEEAWAGWAESYRRFLRAWAEVARDSQVDLLAVGVELRSWVTTSHAPLFSQLIQEVRTIFGGPLTYAANWDDVEQTVIWGELDLIGINAFYPLAEQTGAKLQTLTDGGREVARRVARTAKEWRRPVIFTEFGYTTRTDPAVRPWEWPDFMSQVTVDQLAQADAYAALLGPMLEKPWFAGAFCWRFYADPEDQSQEAEWGFSPRGKLAELVLRDAFAAHWAADGERPLGFALGSTAAERIGVF